MEGISVVIISRGRKALLADLLQSVRNAQERTVFPTEIVMVDSTQEEEEREKIRVLSENCGARYYYQDITVSAKRNYGVRQCRFPYILFLDSDCLATPDIFQCYAATYEAHPDAGGAAGSLEFTGKDTWFWKVIQKTPYAIFFSATKWGETVVWAPTANFSVKKDVFLALNGFDETFPKNPGGEDVDLGLRLTKAGYRIYSAPSALVYHSKATWSPVKAMFRRVFHYGAGDAHLMARYPEMTCVCLPRRVLMLFLAVLIYCALGLCVSGRFFLFALFLPALEIAVNSMLVNHFLKYKSTTFLRQLVVQCLLLWNECGYLAECIHTRRLDLLQKQFIHFKPQMDGICAQNILRPVR